MEEVTELLGAVKLLLKDDERELLAIGAEIIGCEAVGVGVVKTFFGIGCGSFTGTGVGLGGAVCALIGSGGVTGGGGVFALIGSGSRSGRASGSTIGLDSILGSRSGCGLGLSTIINSMGSAALAT